MIVIKEFLADPAGPDTGAEYIALFNSGTTTVSLIGWRLQDKSGKAFDLSPYSVPAGKQLRLFSSATKITLNNSGETVSLFNASGLLIDELAQTGKAISGEAFRRISDLSPALRAQFFDELATTSLPVSAAPTGQVVLFWLPVSILLALAAVFIMRTIREGAHEDFGQKNIESGANG